MDSCTVDISEISSDWSNSCGGGEVVGKEINHQEAVIVSKRVSTWASPVSDISAPAPRLTSPVSHTAHSQIASCQSTNWFHQKVTSYLRVISLAPLYPEVGGQPWSFYEGLGKKDVWLCVAHGLWSGSPVVSAAVGMRHRVYVNQLWPCSKDYLWMLNLNFPILLTCHEIMLFWYF